MDIQFNSSTDPIEENQLHSLLSSVTTGIRQEITRDLRQNQIPFRHVNIYATGSYRKQRNNPSHFTYLELVYEIENTSDDRKETIIGITDNIHKKYSDKIYNMTYIAPVVYSLSLNKVKCYTCKVNEKPLY